MFRILRFVALLSLLLLPATPIVHGDGPTGREIMEKADKLHRAEDEKSVVKVVIVTASGNRRERELEMFSKSGSGDDDKTLFRFTEPDEVEGTALLTLEHSDRSDDQWVYLPALNKAKRIAGSGRTGNFAGTDFTYEDLRTEELHRHSYELLRKESYRKKECYVVKALPNKEKAEETNYGKRIFWITTDNYLIYKIAYYDEQGRPLKVLLNGAHKKVDGHWRLHIAEMRNVREKTKTLMRFVDRTINPGLSNRLFTKANLGR